VALGRLDALEVADRIGDDGLVEHGLVHHPADDGADHSPSVGRELRLLGRRAVGQLNELAATLQAREEGIEVGDVALSQPQLAELGEHLVAQAAGVGVHGRVGAPLTDFAHPDVGRLAEPRVGLEDLRALLSGALAQLVLERGLRAGLGGAPAGDAAGDTVEVAEAAAGDPLTVVAAYLDRAVTPKGEGRTGHGGSSGEGFRRVSDKFDLRKQ
jgi:hypothetical protein